MRENLNIFIDPKTQNNLILKVKCKNRNEIISGQLYNASKVYPVIGGIPRFVDEAFYKNQLGDSMEFQTTNSFGAKWREKRNRNLGIVKKDIKDLKEQFMSILGCESEFQLKGLFKNCRRTLNAGCGVAWSEYLFNYNPDTERHCVDISLSVETAYEKTKKLKNVIVSQASIFQLPYRANTFDIIYSNGVIHHTPDPQKAFSILVEKLVPGGLIGIYVYALKPFLREIADRQIRGITTKMSYSECIKFAEKMSELGKAFNDIKKPLVIKRDIGLLNIKSGKYNLHKFIYDHFIKCWFDPQRDKRYADLVNLDWYHPSYASHHTKEEVICWFRKAGIKQLKCIQPRGWEYSGYFVSGRKRRENG